MNLTADQMDKPQELADNYPHNYSEGNWSYTGYDNTMSYNDDGCPVHHPMNGVTELEFLCYLASKTKHWGTRAIYDAKVVVSQAIGYNGDTISHAKTARNAKSTPAMLRKLLQGYEYPIEGTILEINDANELGNYLLSGIVDENGEER